MGSEDHLAQHKESLALAAEILADLELSRLPLANIAMKCVRLARLTGDEQARRWFRAEAGGYDLDADPDLFGIAWAVGRGTAETRDKPDGERLVWTDSIAALESIVDTSREELKHLDIPPMTEGSTRNEYYFPGTTLKQIVDTFLTHQRSISSQITYQVRILAQIRRSIHAWALNRYHLLRFVDIPADAFQRAKALVDKRLAVIAPDALRMFAAAQDRARSGSPEEWSQAMTSLRRMMKAVADVLYPATGETVNGHALDDAHYVNRLWQYVHNRAVSDRRAVLSTQIEYIGHRIDTLNDLASKGIHDAVTQQEVELCVVHLYLLFADLLSMLTPEELMALTVQPQEVAPAVGVIAEGASS